MSLLGTRLSALFVLFSLTLFVGIVPVFVFRYWTKKKNNSCLDITGSKSGKDRSGKVDKSAVVLQLLMFFGGGVLLATCFIHLIPEVRENFEQYFKSLNKSAVHTEDDHSHPHTHSHEDEENHTDHYHDDHHDGHSNDGHTHDGHSHTAGHTHNHGVPYVELAICVGFFIIYFLEELIHAIIGHDHHGDHNHSQGSSLEIENEFNCGDLRNEKNNSVSFDATAKNSKNTPPFLISCSSRPEMDAKHEAYDNYAVDLRGDSCHPVYCTQISRDSSSHIIPAQSIETMSSIDSTTKLPVFVRFIQGLVTIGAFSAHSIFDGVAIGLQNSSSQIWTMLFAISVHKLVVAFVVGMELFEQTKSVAITSVHMTLFSLTSPIGILLVIVTESSVAEGQSPVFIILSAVATGTILYIIFFEILRRDKKQSVPGMVLFLAMIIGFSIMLCITLFIAH